MATGDPIMINRKLADIIKGQKLVALAERETVQPLGPRLLSRRLRRSGYVWIERRFNGEFQ